MSNPAFQKIEEVIRSKPVAIFMKGSPDSPQCGFSARACDVLEAAGIPKDQLAYFDVLSDEGVRSAIKDFSKWPTIPQIFIKGKFVGGSDIVMEMYESGELQELLNG